MGHHERQRFILSEGTEMLYLVQQSVSNLPTAAERQGYTEEADALNNATAAIHLAGYMIAKNEGHTLTAKHHYDKAAEAAPSKIESFVTAPSDWQSRFLFENINVPQNGDLTLHAYLARQIGDLTSRKQCEDKLKAVRGMSIIKPNPVPAIQRERKAA